MIVNTIEYSHKGKALHTSYLSNESGISIIPKAGSYAYFIRNKAYEISRLEYHPERKTIVACMLEIDPE